MMKLRYAIPFAALLAACSTPQYTVMNAAPQGGTTASGQATSYPDLATAPTGDEKSKNVAVVVAIEDYAFLPDVPGAVDNAVAWENYLRNTRGFGDVFVLTNKQAPIEEIKRFTSQAAAAAPEGGELWFVFIGHGAALKDGTDGALIGMDAQQTIESIGSRSFAQKELLASLDKGKQAKTVVVLDTCFSGRDSGGELLAAGTQPVIAIDPAPTSKAGTIVMSAAGNDEVAGQLPGDAKPAFSYLLLGALRGWADDGDGNVTADEAINWTRQQLRYVPGRQQTPSVSGDGTIALAKSAGEDDPGIAALIKAGGNVAPAQPSAPATPGGTDGAPRVDTHKGITFVHPPEWGMGPVGMGVIINLTNQYTGNTITVMRQKIKQQWAGSVLQPAPRFDTQEVQIQSGPDRTEYGANTGMESEYRLIDNDENFPKDLRIVRFGTYQNGYAWVIELNSTDAATLNADYAAFQKFVEELTFY